MLEAVAPPRYRLRPATAGDFAFLHVLHVVTLKGYVTQTWGWDDAAQAARFRDGFRPEASQIVLIVPEQQGHGIGAALIGDVLAEAARAGVATRLQVLRVNPARRLYERLGFAIEGETSTHYLMRADPDRQAASPLRAESNGRG